MRKDLGNIFFSTITNSILKLFKLARYILFLLLPYIIYSPQHWFLLCVLWFLLTLILDLLESILIGRGILFFLGVICHMYVLVYLLGEMFICLQRESLGEQILACLSQYFNPKSNVDSLKECLYVMGRVRWNNKVSWYNNFELQCMRCMDLIIDKQCMNSILDNLIVQICPAEHVV